MRKLREEMEQATRDRDEETRMELEIEAKRMQKEMERVLNDAKRLGSKHKTRKPDGRLAPVQETSAVQSWRQMDDPESALRVNNSPWNVERTRPLSQVDEPPNRRGNARIYLLGFVVVLLLTILGTILAHVLK